MLHRWCAEPVAGTWSEQYASLAEMREGIRAHERQYNVRYSKTVSSKGFGYTGRKRISLNSVVANVTCETTFNHCCVYFCDV